MNELDMLSKEDLLNLYKFLSICSSIFIPSLILKKLSEKIASKS